MSPRQKIPKHLVIGLWLLIWGASAVYARVAQPPGRWPWASKWLLTASAAILIPIGGFLILLGALGASGTDASLDGLARALVPLAVWSLIGVSTATTGLTHLFARQAAPYQERLFGLGLVLLSLYAVSRIWRLLRQWITQLRHSQD